MGFYGDLDDLPLQHILHVLESQGKSGRLTLRTSDDEITILFDRGRVAAVSSTDVNLRIGRVLVEQGLVSELDIEEALALQSVSAEPARIGDILVEVGAVAPREVGQAVAAQFEASLIRILVQPGGSFSFSPEISITADPLMAEVPIEATILNAVRIADEQVARRGAAERVALTDAPANPDVLDKLEGAGKQVLLAILNGAETFEDLARATSVPASDLNRILAHLEDVGMVSGARGALN